MTNDETAGSAVSARQQRGGVLVEGVAALWMLTVLIVGGVLLLANVGLMLFYKEKIGFIADQAAVFAANVPLDQDPTDPTTSFVKDTLSKLGLPKANSVTVQRCSLGGAAGVSVNIKCGGLGLIGKGDLIPAFISIDGTGAATMTNMQPPGVLYLWTRDLNRSPSTMPNTIVAIPCWGRRTSASGVLQAPDFARPPGVAMFPRAFSEAYSMSFPLGGFNENIPLAGIRYAHWDNDPNFFPNTGPNNGPPADY